ncbi:fungal-specific transcription factor domain-containing protein, partial [Xylariaceae sp. FL1651]
MAPGSSVPGNFPGGNTNYRYRKRCRLSSDNTARPAVASNSSSLAPTACWANSMLPEFCAAELQPNELWTNQSFFSVGVPRLSAAFTSSSDNSLEEIDWRAEWWDDPAAPLLLQQSRHIAEDGHLKDVLSPGVPLLERRTVDFDLTNPYTDSGQSRNPVNRSSRHKLVDKAVNGYIKFRLRHTNNHQQPASTIPRCWNSPAVERPQQQERSSLPWDTVSYPPRNFGRGFRLDDTELKLFRFYTIAYCEGRTILPNGNYWLSEFPAMCEKDDAVKHAILALAGAYVLDYVQHESLRAKVNNHYYLASECISKRLNEVETHEICKGEAVVSAIVLMMTEDTVNWELRKSKDDEPHWLRGAYLAKEILDRTDPGYRYWKLENVQVSKARASNGNIVAQTCILAQIVLPLRRNDSHSGFGWLLEGSAKEVRRIRSTGLSPKLLHIFYQITSLCNRLKDNPRSQVLPLIATKLFEKLNNFRQWSELSSGHESMAALLDSCDLDEQGKVHNPAQVVEVTGEIWVWCAKIYLQCRFFRKPFMHPDVCKSRKTLRDLLKRLPSEGEYFTSHYPFFALALDSLLSCTDEERELPRKWFTSLVAEASCRSSVPPVWDTLQQLWGWMDGSLSTGLVESYKEDQIVGERRDWWEEMVTYILEKFGYIHL